VLRFEIEVHADGRLQRTAVDSVENSGVRPPPTVEALTEEIGRIVAERQELRAAGAASEVLEENRRRLTEAQHRLSLLLIERHLPAAESG
jgi:hypothetical protein